MLILRNKKFSITENYYPQVSDYLLSGTNNIMGVTEGTIGKIEDTKIGQTKPIKKKTRLVRNALSGIKAYLPKKKRDT
jgi:hypothetical protein